MPSSMPSSISLLDLPPAARRARTTADGLGLVGGASATLVGWRELRSKRRGSGERRASRSLRRGGAGGRVLRQEAGQRISDRLELLGGAGVQVRSRLGLGDAALSDGLQSLPLVVVPLLRSDTPHCAVALTPVCGAIGAQDMRRSPAGPVKAKRVQGECGSADNQHPADEVVPSGLQELHGRLHGRSTLNWLRKGRGGHSEDTRRTLGGHSEDTGTVGVRDHDARQSHGPNEGADGRGRTSTCRKVVRERLKKG